MHEFEFLGSQLGGEAALNFIAQRFVGAGLHGVAQLREDDSQNGMIFVTAGDIGVAAGFVSRFRDSAKNIVSRCSGDRRTGVEKNQREFISRTLGALALKAEHSEKQLFGQDVSRKVEWVRSRSRHYAGRGTHRRFPVWPGGGQASSFSFKLHGDFHRWFGSISFAWLGPGHGFGATCDFRCNLSNSPWRCCWIRWLCNWTKGSLRKESTRKPITPEPWGDDRSHSVFPGGCN